MKKRIVSLLLASAMVMGMTVSAFAVDSAAYEDNVNIEQEVFDGEIYSATQDFENVFISESGKYLLRVYEKSEDGIAPLSEEAPAEKEILIPVERIDADFSDANSILAFSQLEDIPQIIIDDLKQNYENYLTANDPEYIPHATLFTPVASANSTSSNPIYKTLNGYRMKTYQVHYTNESTGWKNVNKGKSTLNSVKTIKDVVLTALSLGSSSISLPVSYFSSGISIFQSFLNYTSLNQNQISSSTGDYFQMRFVFDKINQYTATDYGNPGDENYQVQLVTYKATIRRIGSEVYFAETNTDPVTVDRDCNEVIKSGHYNDPWATALKRGQYNPGYEDISYQTGGVTFTFER